MLGVTRTCAFSSDGYMAIGFETSLICPSPELSLKGLLSLALEMFLSRGMAWRFKATSCWMRWE